MYELTIRAETLAELSGRIYALAAEFSGAPKNTSAAVAAAGLPVPQPVYESTVTTARSRAEALSSATGSEIPYEQVRSAILRVAAKHGREGVDRLLTQFGATTNAKEIASERYPEVLSAVEEMLG